MPDNQTLLAEYVQSGSDAAFRELVTRYVNLVYSTALRLVGGDTHRAEDVAQTVFVDLARLARTLPTDVKLGGWLHRHTCFVGTTLMRGERRRQHRERQAAEMNGLQNNSDAEYLLVAPILDEAINELMDADRTAILLRFFEQHDFRAVGQALGTNEDAARMRVMRALEKLEGFLKRRGITATANALGVVLSAGAVQAAPVGLAVTISTAAAVAGATITATTTAAAAKTIAMTLLQKNLITAAIVAAMVIPLLVQHQAIVEARVERSALSTRLRDLPVDAPTTSAVVVADNRAQQETDDLQRLRREIATLRSKIAELTTQAERFRTAKLSEKVGSTPIGQTLRLADVRDAGQATPAALLQTYIWAMLHGDTNRLAQIMAFDPQMDTLVVQRLFDEIHKNEAKGKDAILAKMQLSEMRFLEEQPAENNERWIVNEAVRTNDAVAGHMRVRVRLTGADWKLIMGIDGPVVETIDEQP